MAPSPARVAVAGLFPALMCAEAMAWALQSPLAPHSAQASTTAVLAWVLFIGGGVAFLVVAVAAVYALTRTRQRPSRVSARMLLVGGGIVFPSVVLVALVIYLSAIGTRSDGAGTSPLRLQVTGEMWWWRVHYVAADGSLQLATANQLVVPVGRPVEIELRTGDVIHSLWVPGLSGMLDMIPGRVNTLRFTAERPGVLRGQCAEFCGLQHAKMGLDVRVLDTEDFATWFDREREPARPAGALHARGQQLFVTHCASCHTVRGTAATATQGPDLTHVASRASIASSTLPNNAGTLAGWIVSGQHLKPGNRMPEFRDLRGTDLTALADYLATLQ